VRGPTGRPLPRPAFLAALLLATALAACTAPPQALPPTPWPPEATQPPLTTAVEGDGAAAACTPRPERVLIISLDGLTPEALLRAQAPNLQALWQEGAYSWRAQTVLPSVTLPAHASMLSGLDVPRHGITWNDWLPQRGYLQAPTVFTLARGQGLKVAAFVGKDKLRHLAPPGSTDHFQVAGYRARDIVPRALDYLLRERPQLLFLHLPDPDSAGHAWGWGSPAQLQAVAEADAALGLLFDGLRQAGLWQGTLVIVTADHGGHDRVHGSADPRDTTIPWIVHGPGIRRGLELQGPVRVYDTAPTALWALGLPLPEGWDGRPVLEALEPALAPCPAVAPSP
jgi:predicted AlkP superfamily pyrophosphatase or phosphodiesterase